MQKLSLLVVIMFASFSGASDYEVTKEQRAQMAEMHRQAAECLKSDKPLEKCREQMMADCPMARDGECPMMAMGKHKMHHREMMKSGDEKPMPKSKN